MGVVNVARKWWLLFYALATKKLSFVDVDIVNNISI